MATYYRMPVSVDERANHDTSRVWCDDHSTFDPNGFPLPGMQWYPLYGRPCVECGKDC
jgi:hypothetical protein